MLKALKICNNCNNYLLQKYTRCASNFLEYKKGGKNLEEFTLILNDFLFNSGILGFYRIMKKVDKEKYLTIDGNTLKVQKQA